MRVGRFQYKSRPIVWDYLLHLGRKKLYWTQKFFQYPDGSERHAKILLTVLPMLLEQAIRYDNGTAAELNGNNTLPRKEGIDGYVDGKLRDKAMEMILLAEVRQEILKNNPETDLFYPEPILDVLQQDYQQYLFGNISFQALVEKTKSNLSNKAFLLADLDARTNPCTPIRVIRLIQVLLRIASFISELPTVGMVRR